MTLTVISLGAGVQSTTMALMAAHGEITPMPDCAIFADTGWEPKAVYDQLKKLTATLPFPVHVVSAGNIRDNIISSVNTTGQRFAAVPWFVDSGGAGGMGRRQCTSEFKIGPLEKKQRELLGYKPRQRIPHGSIEVWIGISWDEMQRMKDPRNKWQINRWPLIEKEMRRSDCLKWLEDKGWTAPKSSCLGCPYHSDAQWREIKQNPEEWADVVEVDRLLREGGTARGMRHHQYMHRSLKPLDEVDLLSAEDRGQMNMFNDECDGMCGI
jgi:hypothetical protein